MKLIYEKGGSLQSREKRTEKCKVDLLGSNSTLKYFNLFRPTTSKKIEKHIFYDEILDLQDFQGWPRR